MLEVIINSTGEKLDIRGGIKYTFQAAEIGDISRINSNWSWSINFPRSPKNEQTFQGLGLINSQSIIPYAEISVTIRYNSISIIKSGKLVISETDSENYKGHITDGTSDFMSEIGDLLLSQLPEVLDPANQLNHDRNVTNIVNSWSINGSTEVYKYIIANYNGELTTDPLTTDFVAAFLLPSVSVKFLFDAIFNFAGWTYQGLPDLDEDWMTYGNRVESSEAIGLSVGSFKFDNLVKNDFLITGLGIVYTDFISYQDEFYDINYIDYTNSSTITINTSGDYNIKTPKPTRLYGVQYWYYELGVHINGILITKNDSRNWRDEISIGNLSQNDEISFRFQFYNFNTSLFDGMVIEFGDAFEVINKNVISTNIQSKSLDMKAKDFVKDVMIRYATSAFSDIENKEIKFMNIEERVNAEVVDWSSKYQGRTSESYVLDGYAQNNYIRHSYGNENDKYHDGNLTVLNKNIGEDRTLYKSPFYSSDLENFVGVNGVDFVGLKSYEIELTNTGEKITPLNDRFHYIRYFRDNRDGIKINGTVYNGFDTAESQNFSRIVPERYEAINSLINRAKIVNIDLDLSAFDLRNIRMDVVYYFQQEAARFLLNKLTWDSENAISKGEFIKIQNS